MPELLFWWRALTPWQGWLGLSTCLLLCQTLLTLSLIPLARQLEPLFQRLELWALASLLGWICGVYLLKNALEYAQKLSLEWVAGQWMLAQRRQVFARVLQTPWPVLQTQPPDKVLTILSDDLNHLRRALLATLHRLVPSSLTLLALLGVACWISWQLTALLVLVLPLFNRLLQSLGQVLLRRAHHLQARVDRVLQVLNESLQHPQLVRLYRLQHWRQTELEQAQGAWLRQHFSTLRWRELERPLLGSLQVCAIAILLGFSAWLVAQGALQPADLLAFATTLALAIDPGLWLAESRAELQVATASWQRLQALAKLPSEDIQAYPEHPQGGFRCEQLEVSQGDQPVLRGLSLSLQPGQKIGLTGPSGAGKSTLLQVLAGLLPCSSGQIFWPAGWQKQPFAVLLVPQRAGLFNASLRDNLCAQRKPEAETLAQVLDICQLKAVVSHLPQGLDTPLGPGGNRLSGGEKQRVALARALLLRPSLLLLDESTSELDLATEALILQGLRQNYPDMSWILVSHRHSSLQNLDALWHLREGHLHPTPEEPCPTPPHSTGKTL